MTPPYFDADGHAMRVGFFIWVKRERGCRADMPEVAWCAEDMTRFNAEIAFEG